MKKIFLALTIFVGVANATEVAVCKFKGNAITGFANDPIVCSGAVDKKTTIEDMYAEGWSYKGSYQLKVSNDTYIVMEKGDK